MTNVFIISDHNMFSYGLENLLGHEPQFKVVGRELNTDVALKKIEKLKPDVVVIYSDNPSREFKSIAVNVLKTRTETKVVGLNVHDNTCCTYQVKQWLSNRVSDLIEAIKHPASGVADHYCREPIVEPIITVDQPLK